ncbi:hypothetical protein DICVIV_05290 [Dictyocaulus viviparus]|uniref:Uncharacterized protein n=1 Tax=Dictyocaulus viviparus TaxID=29172 RepID=A0A0D8XVD5_DICVI|nr:hypothetical protein DICVIV_05290 [Dictyocaulus viviparus]
MGGATREILLDPAYGCIKYVSGPIPSGAGQVPPAPYASANPNIGGGGNVGPSYAGVYSNPPSVSKNLVYKTLKTYLHPLLNLLAIKSTTSDDDTPEFLIRNENLRYRNF